MIFCSFFQIFDASGTQLHPEGGFTGSELPQEIVSAFGEMQIRFVSDSLESSKGFSAVFSADCPDLVKGAGKYQSFQMFYEF